jgi:hypothetical protein
MSNRKREKGKILLCSLLLALYSLIFACDNPLVPSEPATIPAGKGSFSLSVTVTDTARTILPTLDQGKFILYTLDFTVVSGGQAISEERSPANLAAPVYLDPGTYKLTVKAYLGPGETKLVARGESIDNIVIIEGESTEGEIILKAIIEDYAEEDYTEGKFTYNVSFPSGVAAAMKITPLKATGTPEQNPSLVSGVTGTIPLKTGYYNVEFTLVKNNDNTLVWWEWLHIYANLESTFTRTFTDDDFYKTIYTVTFIFNNGDTPGKESVLHGNTVSEPSLDIKKAGHIFDDWYADIGCTTKFDFDEKIISDTEVYAGWTLITLPLTDVNHIVPYLAGQTGGADSGSMVDLSFQLDLGTMTAASSNWQLMLVELGKANKFVNLVLSDCTMSGGPVGAPQFNPVSAVATGKNRIVNITLPTVAQSIGPDGTNANTSAFNNFTVLTSFSGTGLTTIGNYAFYNRASLTQTTLPTNLTSIGNSAFIFCTGLALTTLPANLLTIGASSFYGCENLALTALPAGLISIGNSAFTNCPKLTLSILPGSLTSIGITTFQGCTGLTTIAWPLGVTTIDQNTFNGCTNLTSITLPETLKNINFQAFADCTKLVLTSLPEGLEIIDRNGFYNCTSLALTTLPSTLKTIGNGAFTSCMGITSITLPESLTSIELNAFAGCTNLTLVTCLMTTPPTAGATIFGSGNYISANLRIKVPSNSLAAYKTAANWDTYKERIFAGEGTADDPFRIYDDGDLRRMVGQNIFSATWTLGAHYRMIADITLTGTNNWTAIGNLTAKFSGVFDGDGHGISGLSISGTTPYQGLFGCLSGDAAVVKNLALVNVSITSTAANVGGVAGFIGDEAVVENCYVTGSVSGDNTSVGGVVGDNEGTVKNCYVIANVSGSMAVGGVVGENYGTIQNCYVTGSVSANSYAGGVVGATYFNDAVSNCVALSPNITVDTSFGRIMGYFMNASMANNYARSDMQKDGKYFTWQNAGLTTSNGKDITAGEYHDSGWWKSAANTGPAFDFDSAEAAWEWHSTNNLPILKGFAPNTQNPTVTVSSTMVLTITIMQIENLTPEVTIPTGGIIISRSGAGGLPKAFELSAPNGYTSYQWSVDGVGSNPLSTGPSVTVSADKNTGNVKNSIGGHTLYLEVRKGIAPNDVPYSKIIRFTIVE